MEETFSDPIAKMHFRKLGPEEEQKFRKWARENWKPGDKVDVLWHPVVRNEIEQMKDEQAKLELAKLVNGMKEEAQL